MEFKHTRQKDRILCFKKRAAVLALTGICLTGLGACAKEETASGELQPGEMQEQQEQEQQEQEQQEQEPQQEQEQQEQEQQEPQGTSKTEETLTGEIYELGSGKFIINKIYLDTGEGGTETMAVPLEEENMTLISVVYDEHTEFFRKAVQEGGEDYKESAGSSEDLKEGAVAELEGRYEGEEFHASKIRITESKQQ